MRILFNNLVNTSTLSATTENSFYPLANIKHPFLKKIYKATGNNTTVTITFSSVSSVDSCFIGLTNSASAVLKLYSATRVLLATENINVSTNGNVFTKVSGVSYCTIGFSATAPVYVGNIGVGKTYTMPDPLAEIIPDFVDNSEESISADGQLIANKVDWLKLVESSYFVDNIDDYNYIYSLFRSIDRPIWVAFFENTVDTINPLYSKVAFKAGKYKNRLYTFDVSVQEVR